MANERESLINVVIDTAPKVLKGADVVGSGVPNSPDADRQDHRRRGEAYPIPGTHAERGKPIALPWGTADRKGRPGGSGYMKMEQAKAAL